MSYLNDGEKVLWNVDLEDLRVTTYQLKRDFLAAKTITIPPENRVYIMGGISNGKPSSACYEYVLENSELVSVAPMKIPKYGMALCYIPKYEMIVSVGGRGAQTRLGITEIYSPRKNQWKMVGNLNKPRAAASVVFTPSGLWCFGGVN